MKRKSLPAVTNYIAVLSIDECVSEIEQSEGKVTVPKTEIQNMGFFAMFQDSENNLFGL
jgi:predicted enzyme related to lactoylglutathione lyase